MSSLLALGGPVNLTMLPFEDNKGFYLVPVAPGVKFYREHSDPIEPTDTEVHRYNVHTLAYGEFRRKVYVSISISETQALNILREYLLQDFIRKGAQ